jgi:TonB family protein
MIQRIRANWNDRPGAVGQTVMMFTIQRDGRITGIAVEKSSGNQTLDANAQRALALTDGQRQLPPLPEPFPNSTLTVHLNFEYTR